MKKTTTLFAALLLLAAVAQARNLSAFLSYATFLSPEGPFIETYLAVQANSVKFVRMENGKYQARVNILMTFKKDNEIKAFRKYELSSEEVADTLKLDFQFIDQQRFILPNGTYDFEIQLSDAAKSVPALPYSQPVTIDYPAGEPAFSGIEMVKSYTKSASPTALSKSGYDLIPYVYSFFPESETKMTFYAELYNMAAKLGQDQKFLLTYYIESFESNVKLTAYSKARKETARGVNVVLTEIDIYHLPTGNYNLVLEARNQQNALITSKKAFFQRRNPGAQITMADLGATEIGNTFAEKITNTDSIREFINSTYPIGTGMEKAFIRESLKKADLKTMQQFLYSFWVNHDPANPETAFLNYKEMVKKVDANFGTPVKKGYQTDRGRVFLVYGPPNTRSQQYMEPSNYPYEIWQYYKLSNAQANRKFVFYSPDMVTSDFVLLHSDATGEINNPRWQVDLRNRIYSTLDIGDTQVINAWGDMQQDYWELPN